MAFNPAFLGRLEDAATQARRVVPYVPSLAAVLAGLEPELAKAPQGPRTEDFADIARW
jgi:hypothetical protein